MDFENIWAALVRKKEALANPEAEVTFLSKNLKALLKQVFDQGVRSSDDMHKAARKFKDLGRQSGSTDPMEMFNSIFGR